MKRIPFNPLAGLMAAQQLTVFSEFATWREPEPEFLFYGFDRHDPMSELLLLEASRRPSLHFTGFEGTGLTPEQLWETVKPSFKWEPLSLVSTPASQPSMFSIADLLPIEREAPVARRDQLLATATALPLITAN